MATKRKVIAQISVEDLHLVAEAAEAGSKGMETKQARKVKRAAKLLRTAGNETTEAAK
jgi:hypothetical protein